MIVLTDSVTFAQECVPHAGHWQECRVTALGAAERNLASELFEVGSILATEVPNGGRWDYLFAVRRARGSQYDVLAELAGSGEGMPGRVLCCAGEGERFHGFKGRSWQACRGNIHLSACVEPGIKVTGGAAGFIVAAVVSALQATEEVDLQGRLPAIKWVNDLLVDGAKVGGVLARLQTQSEIVKRAVLGIGLNVEQRPVVERDPYVPAVAALADYAAVPGDCRHANVFPHLAQRLGENIERLYRGQFEQLLQVYRERSVVVGRQVTIREDGRETGADAIATGRVRSIGPELELYLEGYPDPITKGRVVLEQDA